MSKDMKQEYYEYVYQYLEKEAKENFINTIDDADSNFLYSYSSEVMDSMCQNIKGFENEDLKNYVFNELLLASQVGFVLNSANKRFSLESPENSSFMEDKKKFKNKVPIKDRILLFLINLLNK